jgi:hypothetical protein
MRQGYFRRSHRPAVIGPCGVEDAVKMRGIIAVGGSSDIGGARGEVGKGLGVS